MSPLAPLYRFADYLRYRRHLDLGRRGEDLAHRYLQRNGFIVVARNWRPPQGGGEIDLIAWDGETLVFVEVKTRAVNDLSMPEREIDREKRRVLRRSANDYLRRCGVNSGVSTLEQKEKPVRADVLAIDAGRSQEFQVRHYRDAFRVF